MAIKGVAIPVFGDYRFNGAQVTYENGFQCGSAVEYSIEVEQGESNPLFGDDKIVENEKASFSKGTLTLNTTDLIPEDSKRLLGLKEVVKNYGDLEVKELVYDDDLNVPTKGFGLVETHQVNGETKYRAVVICRVDMNIPSDAATTKGETVEWQTKEVSGAISRSEQKDDDYKHPWKKEAWFDSLDNAMEYLRYILNALETLTVTSIEGTGSGQTKIQIENALQIDTFKYSTEGPVPTYKQDLTSWNELTLNTDITEATGTVLHIAKVDKDKKAIGYGTVKVVAKGDA